MSEEQQLTVAELLARARKENPEAEPRTRRRRRTLEEGGISVAELTGSFPKVDSVPSQPRHSSVPLDSSAPEYAQHAERTHQSPGKTPGQDHWFKVVQDVEHEVSADAVKGDDAPQEKAPEPEPIPEVVEPDEELVAAEAAPEVAHEVVADATTKFVAQPLADAPIEAEPEEASPGDQPTAIMSVVQDDPESPEAEAAENLKAEAPAGTASAEPSEAVKEAEPTQAEEKGGRTNIAAVIGMAVVGIVFGVVCFLAFEILWSSSLPAWAVAIGAVTVTAIMMAIVRALRAAGDMATVLLAGFVGLVLTFGPAIIAA